MPGEIIIEFPQDGILLPYSGHLLCYGSKINTPDLSKLEGRLRIRRADPPNTHPGRWLNDTDRSVQNLLAALEAQWAIAFYDIPQEFYRRPTTLIVEIDDEEIRDTCRFGWTHKVKKPARLQFYTPTGGITYPTNQDANVPRQFVAVGEVDPTNCIVSATLSNPQSGTLPLGGMMTMPTSPHDWARQFYVPNDWGDNTQWSTLVVQTMDTQGYTATWQALIKFA